MSDSYVYITRAIPKAGLKLLHEHAEVGMWPGEMPVTREVLEQQIARCDGVLTLLSEKVDDDLLDLAPNLKVISNFAVGYDNIDIPAATRRGIPVGNTPGVLTETTADLAFALMMAAARRIPESERYVHRGNWRTWGPQILLGQDVYGATLGIIGFGRIGQAVARRGRGFDMRILYHGGSDEQAAQELGAAEVSLMELVQQSDFISVHVPYKPETHHLIGEDAFSLMKSTAVLVNTSRGGVIDPIALYVALKSGQIFAAGLDVTDPEPIPADDPLLTLENCIIVPHVGSASVVTRDKMAEMAARNLIAGLNGERLPNCVNPEVYGD